MRKFDFTIRGHKYSVEIKNFELNKAEIEVNGTQYKVEINKEIKQTKTPHLVRPVIVNKGSDKIKKKESSTFYVKSPLPGNILKILCNEGDNVEKGGKLLIMEAMKMENNILAERSGIIKSIKIKVGDSVLQEDTLIEIE